MPEALGRCSPSASYMQALDMLGSRAQDRHNVAI
jgi:hypothetical protein